MANALSATLALRALVLAILAPVLPCPHQGTLIKPSQTRVSQNL